MRYRAAVCCSAVKCDASIFFRQRACRAETEGENSRFGRSIPARRGYRRKGRPHLGFSVVAILRSSSCHPHRPRHRHLSCLCAFPFPSLSSGSPFRLALQLLSCREALVSKEARFDRHSASTDSPSPSMAANDRNAVGSPSYGPHTGSGASYTHQTHATPHRTKNEPSDTFAHQSRRIAPFFFGPASILLQGRQCQGRHQGRQKVAKATQRTV